MNPKVIKFSIIALVLIFAGIFIFRTIDISPRVSKADGLLLTILKSSGINDRDIVLREKSYWKKGRIKGEKITYIFAPKRSVHLSKLGRKLKNDLTGIDGVRLGKFTYKVTEGKTKTAHFNILLGRESILDVIIKNVSSDWMTGPDEELVDNDAPLVAIVLDDFGYTKKNLDDIKDLGIPITMAVLPDAPYSGKVCNFATKNGLELILHLPMEPEKRSDFLEKDTLTVGMKKDTIRRVVRAALDKTPGVIGVSNHMGSKATKDERLMSIVLSELKKKKLFFLDSVTTERSVCTVMAKNINMPFAKRDIFIDNIADRDHILGQMKKIERIALSSGSAIAIGHDRAITIEVLSETIPGMRKKGIRFVGISKMINYDNTRN